jgi:hypothetical protein
MLDHKDIAFDRGHRDPKRWRLALSISTQNYTEPQEPSRFKPSKASFPWQASWRRLPSRAIGRTESKTSTKSAKQSLGIKVDSDDCCGPK